MPTNSTSGVNSSMRAALETMNEIATQIAAFYIVAETNTAKTLWRIENKAPAPAVSPDLIAEYDRAAFEAVISGLPSAVALLQLLDGSDEYQAAWQAFRQSGSDFDGGSTDPLAEYEQDPAYCRLANAITAMRDSALNLDILSATAVA